MTMSTATNGKPRPARIRLVNPFVWGIAALLCTGALRELEAQSLLSGFNPADNTRGGPQLYSVTGSAGWESVFNPQGGFLSGSSAGLGGDETFGASVTAGWSRRLERGSASIVYTGSYQGYVQHSALGALNHSLSLSGGKHLGAKWGVTVGASSSISTYDQMLFNPTVFSSLVAAPASFDDLSQAVLGGKFNDSQLASLLTGSPLILSPARTVFFGDRMFSSSVSTSLSYAHSQRLSVSFSSNGSRTQHLKGNTQNGVPQGVYLVPRALQVGASLSVAYSLTPRTQMGVSMSSERGFSVLRSAFTTNGTAFIGRNMGRSWFVQAHGGAGFSSSVRTRYASNLGTSPVFGGSLGYKSYAHSLMFGYNRSLGQSYGVGATNMTSIDAAWHWALPGQSWGLMSNYMRQQSSGGIFGSVNGWRTAFGVTRSLGRHAFLETAYTYASYSSSSALLPFNSSQNAVRLTVVWMPQGESR